MEGHQNLSPQANRILEHVKSLRIPTAKAKSTAKDTWFVPRHVLARELGRSKIKILLDYYGISDVSCDTIHEDYLAVFGILITINQTKFIACFIQYEELADNRLPFHDKSQWLPECCVFFDEFKKAQWEFCAQEFRAGRLGDKRLHPDRVIPITARHCLNKGLDSIVEVIDIHPDYNCLLGEGITTALTNKFVLKSYDTKHEALYLNEINAYKMLNQPEIAANVVRMFGSWTQDQTHCILLEFVEGGTLAKLFQGPHPTSSQDRLTLWANLLRVLDPVGRIHERTHPDYQKWLIEGVHQDIKPANILVATDNAKFPFDFTFKLVDMALTYFDLAAAHKGKYRKKDGRGTQTYSAPECFRDEEDAYDERSPYEAHPSKDVWSLGCVFSLALVWSVLGPVKLEEYEQSLKQATARLSRLQDTAYVGCFHDGEKVLEEVRLMHNQVLRSCARADNIIIDMVPIIEAMLDHDTKDRPSAKKVRKSCLKALKRANELSATEANHFHSAFLTQEEMMSRSQKAPGIRDGNNRDALGIEVADPPTSPAAGSFKTVSDTARSSAVSSERMSYIHNKHHSIDNAISNPSPTFASHDGTVSPTEPITEPSHYWPASTSALPQHHMAVHGHHRKHSAHLGDRSEYMAEHAGVAAGASSAGQSSLIQTKNAPLQTSSTQNGPRYKRETTIEEVHVQIQKRKNRIPTSPSFDDLHSLHALRNRDQIFLIDNSLSMQKHWHQVRQAFEVLAYVVKCADPDGMELYFTNWAKSDRQRDRKRLLRLFDCVKQCGQGGMETALSKILDQCTRERPLASVFGHGSDRGVNIYIFTDGIWDGEDDSLCGIPEAIKRTVKRMNTRYSIGIQFIQFGNNSYGTHRLQTLDDGLKEKNIMDIIDHTHVDGNVFKMLLGSIDTYWDDQPSKNDSSSSAQPLPGDLAPNGAARYI